MPRHDRRHEKEVAHIVPKPVRELLSHAVDYAGLFPPAGLGMESAVAQYAEYRKSSDAWMLGRFVVPLARLADFLAERSQLNGDQASPPWPVTLIFGSDSDRDVGLWLDAQGRKLIRIEAVEMKMTDPSDIERHAKPSVDVQVVVEIPIATDPAPLISAIQRAGAIAKARTGGVTVDAFPKPADVVRFVRECIERNTPFKMTAGLHHPVTGTYALTYANDAPRGAMFGYLNVFVASGLLLSGMSDEDAVRVLEDRDPHSFVWDDDAISWQGHRLDQAQARRLRSLMSGFGSCSFREPVDELSALAHSTTAGPS